MNGKFKLQTISAIIFHVFGQNYNFPPSITKSLPQFILKSRCRKEHLIKSSTIYDFFKNSQQSGNMGNIPQDNKGHI